MKPIVLPNLPTSRVRLAAVSENAYDIITSLEQEGIEAVKVGRAEALPTPVAYHSDLQLLHLGSSNILIAKDESTLESQLTKFGFVIQKTYTKLGEEYPQDISLNFLLLNNCCFGLSHIIPLQLKEYCDCRGLQIIHSKQGYARCSVAIVSPKAAITSDVTLYRLLTAAQIDVLLVDPGDIVLDGYDTGFIGGCCGLIDHNRLAFTGDLACYRSGVAVQNFLDRHQVIPVFLKGGKLVDIGGILPLMEE
ncbi:MAG: hypothetical protein RR461_09085 [Angelakisella sp.]